MLQNIPGYRRYWVYSIGIAIVWIVVLTLIDRADPQPAQGVVLIFLGFCISWVSTTIARYVYPPPRRWTDNPV